MQGNTDRSRKGGEPPHHRRPSGTRSRLPSMRKSSRHHNHSPSPCRKLLRVAGDSRKCQPRQAAVRRSSNARSTRSRHHPICSNVRSDRRQNNTIPRRTARSRYTHPPGQCCLGVPRNLYRLRRRHNARPPHTGQIQGRAFGAPRYHTGACNSRPRAKRHPYRAVQHNAPRPSRSPPLHGTASCIRTTRTNGEAGTGRWTCKPNMVRVARPRACCTSPLRHGSRRCGMSDRSGSRSRSPNRNHRAARCRSRAVRRRCRARWQRAPEQGAPEGRPAKRRRRHRHCRGRKPRGTGPPSVASRHPSQRLHFLRSSSSPVLVSGVLCPATRYRNWGSDARPKGEAPKIGRRSSSLRAPPERNSRRRHFGAHCRPPLELTNSASSTPSVSR